MWKILDRWRYRFGDYESYTHFKASLHIVYTLFTHVSNTVSQKRHFLAIIYTFIYTLAITCKI